MSEGVRVAWIAAIASILAAVLGAILGRPVINEVVGTTDKIEQLTEENQALRKKNSELTDEVEGLRSAGIVSEGGKGPQPEPEKSINLDELAHRLAEEKRTQILTLDKSVKGTIAENATREYVFLGTANTPILFTLEQPAKHFWASVDVYDSQGRTLLKEENFINPKDEIPFTPPHNDAYILKLRGDRNFGDYLIIMSLLGEAAL